MAKLLFGLLACCIYSISWSQSLLGNPGFEERNVCTEYQVKCAPEAWFFLPRYARMSPMEKDSNHFEIITMGDPRKDFSVGNFIYTKLFCPLTAGATYRLSFRIYVPTFAYDYLDLWFSGGEPGSRGFSLYGGKKLLSVPPDSVSGNRKKWMQVNYTFTAKGGERFFTMGNFQQRPLEKARKSSRRKRMVEYWIDDVQLYPTEANTPLCAEYEAIKDQVYRNNPRHPGRFIETVKIDSSLLPSPPVIDTVPVIPPVTVTPPVKPAPKTDTLIIPDVLFHFNSSRLNPAFVPRLDSLGRKIRNIPFSRLVIAGHTDNYGTDEYNLVLSTERAITIQNYLADRFRLDREKIETVGYGEAMPRDTNETPAGRQRNRRVEIIIFYE